MAISEEVKTIRAQIRKNVSKWKEEHPDWDTSESMKYLESKVSSNTFRSYRAILPLYCHLDNTTPEQMLSLREKQLRSEDRKEKFHFEDKLIEFQTFLVESHYKANSITCIGFFR